jgi:calcineurin-like phosphoesterase family protein
LKRFALLLLLWGCATAPTSGLVFGVMGDVPYTEGEVRRLDALIDDINRERLEFVIHVGDIGGNACDDWTLAARKAQFSRIRHPFVLIPGDNEWIDCPNSLARLEAWRKFFCEVPLTVERQAGEYCEHMRWTAGGFLFVTLNVQGTNNNARNPAEHWKRMSAVHAWLDDSAALAERGRLGLVVVMQGDPFIVLPRDGYAELREHLVRLGARLPGRLLLVHGDSHTYHDDEPLPGVRRLEVWGSPIVSWIRGEVDDGELRFGAPRYR